MKTNNAPYENDSRPLYSSKDQLPEGLKFEGMTKEDILKTFEKLANSED